MTFVLDLCAMVLAQPRALFPALAYKVYGGGAATVGLLQAAPAAGALVAFLFSGWISRVRLHGVAIVLAVLGYGAAVGAVGLTDLLWWGVLFLALTGAADMVSAAYRSTILQVAAPDHLRGRLQGVFIVVVAGGPRAGDFLAGSVAERRGGAGGAARGRRGVHPRGRARGPGAAATSSATTATTRAPERRDGSRDHCPEPGPGAVVRTIRTEDAADKEVDHEPARGAHRRGVPEPPRRPRPSDASAWSRRAGR